MILLRDLDATLADLADRCRCLRTAKGMTTRQAAYAIGVSHGHYSEIENGRTSLSTATLRKLLAWIGAESVRPGGDN